LTISAPLANAGALNNYGQVSQLNITNTGTTNNFGAFNDVSNNGTLTNALGATVNNYGFIFMGPFAPASIINAGTLNNSGGIFGSIGGGSISNTGTFNNLAGATYNTGEGSLGNALRATVTDAGSMTVYFMGTDGTLNNSGSFNCCTSGQPFSLPWLKRASWSLERCLEV
jgi:hypothetical protein